MTTRNRHSFKFPIRKFDDPVGLWKNFRYMEDFFGRLSSRGSVPTIMVAASNASAQSQAAADFVCSGASDEVTFELARLALPDAKGRIMLSEGTFTFGATWSITASESITLVGVGSDTVITMANSVDDYLITFTPASQAGHRFYLDSLTMNGNSSGNSSGGGVVTNGAVPRIMRCTFVNMPTSGSAVHITADANVEHWIVSECYFSNFSNRDQGIALTIASGQEGAVMNSTFLDWGVCISNSGTNTRIVNNGFRDSTTGINAVAGSTHAYGNVFQSNVGTEFAGGGTLIRGHNNEGDEHDSLATSAHTHAHTDTTGKTSDDHHTEAHTVASHSDTTGTGAELETLTDGSDADALHTHSADGIDTSAIHDDTGSEISAITEKGSPVGGDMILIEDSAAANAKKMVQITNLPTGSDADAIHDNVASEISAIADKASPVGADMLIIEDSEDTNAKKKVTITNLPGGADSDAIHDNVAGEIAAIAEKASPIGADMILIEDSAAADAKKMVQITNLPAGGDTGTDLTTKGDLHGYDTGQNRIPVGTNDHVLTADSAQALGVKWAAAAGGASPLTTKGDLYTYDSADARLAVGSDNQLLIADATESEGVKWANVVPEWVAYLTERQDDEAAHADDDFFGSDSSADYTEQTVSGSAAWTIGRDVLSSVFSGQTAADLSAYLKSITSASAPMTIETRMTLTATPDDFPIGGIGFTDGTGTTANIMGVCWVSADATFLNGGIQLRGGTLTNFDGTPNVVVFNSPGFSMALTLYLRMIWKSANTWQASISLDGNAWFNRSIANQSKTFTPTHFGFITTDYGHGSQFAASFDYLRVYDSDLSV